MSRAALSSIWPIEFAIETFAYDQIELLSDWLDREPEAPIGKWFKRFPGMIACGEGDLLKTFLRLGQAPEGKEIF